MNISTETTPASAQARLRRALSLCRLLVLYGGLGIAKQAIPVAALARWAGAAEPRPRNRPREARTIENVVRLRNVLGSDRDCLHGSLLLYRELVRTGSSPILRVGFRRRGDQLTGHSWVEVDGRVVAESPDDIAPLVVTVSFGAPEL